MSNQPFTNEAGLLACLIHKPDLFAQISSYLMPHHFQDGRLRKAYEEFVGISNVTKSPPDSTTWEHRLMSLGVSSHEDMLLATIYRQIPIELVIPSSIEVYASAIVREWKRVNLLSLSARMQTKLTPGVDIDEVSQEFEQSYFDIANNAGQSSNTIDAATALTRLSEYQDKRDSGEIPLIQTGFHAFDTLIGDIEIEQCVSICARPKMGKTSFKLAMMRYWAKQGIPSAMFQTEMTTHQLMQRLIAIEADIDLGEVLKRQFKEKESVLRYHDALREIRKWPIFLDARSGMTVRYIESESKRLKMKHGIKALIVDHLGEIVSDRKWDSLYNATSSNARGIRNIAGTLKLPLFLGVQLSRKLEDRQDKHPVPSDCRDTGVIEEVSSLMIGLYRDEVYHPTETKTPGIVEIDSMMNRNGPTGRRDFGWNGSRTMIYNL
jgi:replicative DNA helicase